MKSVYSYVIKLLLLSVLLSAVSCDSLLSYRENKNTPRGNFEALWKMLDRKYCYFEEKGVDWDAVYDKYEPEISDYMTDEELLDVMQRMIRELRDGHVYVSAPFDLARYWDWYLDYPPNFNYNIIERNYLGRNSVLVDGGLESRVIDNIGYIYYSSFSYFDEAGMDYLIKKYRGCDGIILDIRNNNGGITTYGKNMLSYFTGRRTKVGYWKEKTGDGHDDFSDYQPLWVEPNRINFTGPVVVLTNRSSYSTANTFPAQISCFPNVTVIGDKTGGGGGVYEDFELPNGWEVGITVMPSFTLDKKSMEPGFEPDIYCQLNRVDEYNGIDTIIEKAFEIIKKQVR